MPSTNSALLEPMLRKLSLWQELSQDDRAALLALPHTLKTLGPSGYIVREGDRAEQSCLLLRGFAMRHKVVGNGGRQILALHVRGDMVDLQNSLLRVADHNVETLSQAEVAFIPREAIIELAARRPAIAMAMWFDTLVDGSIHREWMANIGRRDARARIAHLLCEFGMRLEAIGLGDARDFELPMTQEQVADATGLTPVHVNRVLRSLDRDGLTRRSRKSVHIEDFNQLMQIGDFDPLYLHLPKSVTPGRS